MADLLVIAPHPDDAEIHAGGLIAAHVRQGRSVAIVDATAGELGSRGTRETRAAEAAAAAADLGAARECLGLPDGGLVDGDLLQRAAIVGAIRRHRPRCVVALSGHARHPDHIALAGLVAAAVKAASIRRLAAPGGDESWAEARLVWVEAELPLQPTALVPLSDALWQVKMRAVRRYASQLAGSSGAPTSISRPEFLAWIEARGRVWGEHAGAPWAEAVRAAEPFRLTDLVSA